MTVIQFPDRTHEADVLGVTALSLDDWAFLHMPLVNFQAGHEDGWHAALYIYGLRDCTIKNNGTEAQRFPIGKRECYVDLDPGEEATFRTVELEWWEIEGWPAPPESAPPA